MPPLRLAAVLLVGASLCGCSESPVSSPERLATQHLPNALRIHPRVISGGQPEGAAGFEELRRLGVRTIISVDGAKPDIAAAKQAGLRYVHLPHGYDGVPAARVKELAKAVRDLPGPIYIHCHHGKHRSPAAASTACVAAGLIAPDQALGVLQVAGTSDKYRGLYESVGSARQLEARLLDELQSDFPETVAIPPLAQAMVHIEHSHDRLKLLAANGWKSTTKHPDLVPAHEALILREHFTELLRTEHVKSQPEEFQQLTRTSEQAAEALEAAFNAWRPADPRPKSIDTAFHTLTTTCAKCHETYRDVPLGEKVAK
jgi:protein tyrosine phosphatase (PTP) superfamily phosphohydrolase (DUF442 family)